MTRNKYWKHAISLVLTMTLVLSVLIPATEINAAAKYTKKYNKYSAKWSMSKKGTVKKKVKLKKGKNYLVIYDDAGVYTSDIKISCKKAFLKLGKRRDVYVDRYGTITYN